MRSSRLPESAGSSEEENARTLALSAALVLDLVPREVGIVLLEFGLHPESAICASNPHSKQLAKTPLDWLSKRGNPRGGYCCRWYTYERHLGWLFSRVCTCRRKNECGEGSIDAKTLATPQIATSSAVATSCPGRWVTSETRSYSVLTMKST